MSCSWRLLAVLEARALERRPLPEREKQPCQQEWPFLVADVDEPSKLVDISASFRGGKRQEARGSHKGNRRRRTDSPTARSDRDYALQAITHVQVQHVVGVLCHP